MGASPTSRRRPARGLGPPPPPLLLLLLLPLLGPPAVHGDCGVPTRLTSAQLKEQFRGQQTFSHGAQVSYECRPGYYNPLRKPFNITCLEDNEWSSISDFCERRSCTNPGTPSHGRVDIPVDVKFGSEIYYTCEEGYKLIGSPISTCELSEGKVGWSEAVPDCETIYCLPPPNIAHGMSSAGDQASYAYGSAVTYKCEPSPRGSDKYSLIGNSTISCTLNSQNEGAWSSEPPRCEVVTCTEPTIANGKIISSYISQYNYGDQVIFECNSGYVLRGQSIVVCEVGDKWSPGIPVCEEEPSKPPASLPPDVIDKIKKPEVAHGQVFHLFPVVKKGENITIECNAGYTLKGSSQIQYLGGGKWNPDIPTCNFSVVIIIILAGIFLFSAFGLVFFLYQFYNKRKGTYITDECLKEKTGLNYFVPNEDA
ncbi:membrane cofactor protein isoform X3 [Ornithorhynchus anatinus]|uniref:membrane cofactor protein isoform X3 n=1 Tax=Ornithorhynchus anatinus TaxID=9258 RepID=UPI0010A83EEE|nr:membrane cofactor protein isoform X3 [Ornithorhynchus anatinus]